MLKGLTREFQERYRCLKIWKKICINSEEKLILKQFDMNEKYIDRSIVNSATNISFIISYTNFAKLRIYECIDDLVFMKC